MRCVIAISLMTTVLGVVAAAPASAALSINLSPVSIAGLKPGAVSTSTPASIVIGAGLLERWTLSVSTDVGARMARQSNTSPCLEGVPALNSPLQATYSRLLPTTSLVHASYEIGSLASEVVATGTAPDTVSVSYSQTVGADEALAAGCTYSLTVAYTLAAT